MASPPIATKASTENYPFVCFETITNSAKFTCYAGDQGSIVEYDESTKRAKVQIPRRGERGWVKITNLHIGRRRKYGDVTIDTGFSPQVTASLHTEGIASYDFPITGLLFPLFSAIVDHQGSLTWLPTWSRTVLPTRMAALGLARRIANGVDRAGLTNGYDPNKRWTWREFFSHGRNITPQTNGTGLYGRYYSKFRLGKPLSGSQARVYIGKTSEKFGRRYLEHCNATERPENKDHHTGHYIIARQASQTDSIVEAFLDNMSESEIACAEQAFILLKRTYRPELINWTPQIAPAAGPLAEQVGHAVAEVISNLEDKEPATQLTQLAESLWMKLGWGKHLDTSGGCNKQSPLATVADHEKLLWTLMEYPDRWVYHRSAYKGFSQADRHVLFSKKRILTHDNKLTNYTISRSDGHPLPPKGASIYFSVEIMKRGRHALAFSRLPDLGIWSNWDEANEVALRIRWRDGNQWYSFYLQQPEDKIGLIDATEPGSVGVYMNMVNLRHYLERKTFANPLPWATKWGIARVKQIHYDFLSQTVQLIDPPAPSPAVVPTPVRMEAKLRADYQALGIINYGRLKTDPSIDFRALRGSRSKLCDVCYITQHRRELHPEGYGSNVGAPCVTEGGNQSCTYCYSWGHKCTFSNLNKQKALALSWHPPRPNVAVKIADPGFEKGTLAS